MVGGGESSYVSSPLHASLSGLWPQPPTPLPAPSQMLQTPCHCHPHHRDHLRQHGPPRINPSPTPAPVILSTPPTPSVSPPAAATTDPAQCAPSAVGLPIPPPWPESYVFSADPDHIVCHKCCKRHYNFWWYCHCFMCHMNENRT
jgi:hypothetical protein